MFSATYLTVFAAISLACGGSTTVETVVGPDGVRCQTTLAAPTNPVSFEGGSLNVGITAARDCTWTAASEASWMQLNATSGQGSGSVAVTVARNETTTARSGAIVVNSQRLSVSQEARPCSFELRASPEGLTQEGGRGTVSVSTSTGCAWTAVSSADWLRVLTATGSGSGSVAFEVEANPGGTREGSIRIGGSAVAIRQDGPLGNGSGSGSGGGGNGSGGGTACTFTVAPASINAAVGGGIETLTLTTSASCEWTTSRSATWLSVAPASGRGSAALTVGVERNTGAARSGSVTAGTQVVTVNQAAQPACNATIDPTSATFSASAGEGRVRVASPDTCEWTVNGVPAWINVPTTRGTGSAEIRYTVAANGPSSRSATLMIAGQSFTVTQEAAPACAYTLSATSQNVAAAGGGGEFTVTTDSGCSWSASEAVDWITLTSSSGSGTGKVTFTVAANGGAAREATISVGGQSFRVSQEAMRTCSYTLSSSSQSFPAGGGGGEFTVTTDPGCSWSASEGVDWVTLSSSSGSGTGKVTFTVAANGGAAREATISVGGGQSFRITQEAARTCGYTLSSTSQSFPAAGGGGEFTVTTDVGCSWSASEGVDWVTLTSSSGSGTGKVTFTVSANTGPARETTISAGGQSFRVTQAAP